MMTRRDILAVTTAALAVFLSSCSRKPPAAPVAAPTPPTPPTARVVALSPAVAAIMRDVGLGKLIVGRHAFDTWSDPAIPVCGEQSGNIDYEALLTLRPTHVFLQMAQTPQRLDELGRARGFVVKNYQILSLDEVRLVSRELWNWNGAAATPGGIEQSRAPIEDRMDTAWSRHEGIDNAKVGRVLLLASVDPAGALGPGSWHDDILRRIGGTPALQTGQAYMTLDAEDVLGLAPDAIVLVLPRDPGVGPRERPPTPDELRAMLGAIGRLDIPAVRRGRLALIDHPMGHIPSSAMIDVADDLARVLVAWSK